MRVGVVAFSGSGLVTQQPTDDQAARARRDRPADAAGAARPSPAGCRPRSAPSPARPCSSTTPSRVGRAAGPGPRLPRLGGGDPALRRREHLRAGPARRGRARVDRRGAGLPDRARQRPRARCCEIDGFQVATALDEPLLREIASTTDGRYFAAADEQALAEVYDSIDLAWTVEDRARRGHRAVRRGGRAAPARRAPACPWRGPGGWSNDGLRVAARPARRCSCCLPAGRGLPVAAPAAAPAGGALLQRRADPRGGAGRVGVAPARALRAACWPRWPASAVAAARPQVRTDVPVVGSAVILALDVSGSMCATDVDPNRLSAAQAAVRDVRPGPGRRAPASGSCVFSGFAQVAVAPTTERDGAARRPSTR